MMEVSGGLMVVWAEGVDVWYLEGKRGSGMGILTVDQSQEINVWKSIVLLGQVDLVEGRGCHLGSNLRCEGMCCLVLGTVGWECVIRPHHCLGD